MTRLRKNKITQGLFLFLLLIVSLPIFTLAINFFAPIGEDLSHLWQTVLPRYIINSIVLIIGVGFLSFAIGVLPAWLIAYYNFSFSKVFNVVLFLPLVIPAYVMAYIYGDIFSPHRINFDFRNIFGAIIILSLAFFPYVFLIAKIAFEKISQKVNTSLTIGYSMREIFFKVAIPAIRPAIALSLAIVIMETLSDLGAVHYLAIDNFSTGIYRTWFFMHNQQLATKLAFLLITFVFIVLFLEKYLRGDAAYHTNLYSKKISKACLKGRSNFLAFAFCFLIFLFSFLIPILQLTYWGINLSSENINFTKLFSLTSNTVILAFSASLITVFFAILIGYFVRFGKINSCFKILVRIATSGYIFPGAVLAIGVLLFAKYLQNFGLEINVILLLLFAYMFRFLTVACNALEPGFNQINSGVHNAVLLLKNNSYQAAKVHLPILNRNIVAASILVFVEVAKELPLTLIIRPFNFDTLAIYAYELAEDERLASASLPSIFIVLVCLFGMVMHKIFAKKETG